MMASLDAAGEWLLGPGKGEYDRVARRVAQLRRRFPSVGAGDGKDLPWDPTRLTVKVKNGPAFARALEDMGIYPEMEDGGHVVFICTAQDREEDLDRLERALETLERDMAPVRPSPRPPPRSGCSPPDRPCSPHGDPAPGGLPGPRRRWTAGPLSPRRPRGGPRGADREKRTFLFRPDRV